MKFMMTSVTFEKTQIKTLKFYKILWWMVMNIGYIMIHQWELGDHNSLKQDTHGCGGIFGGLRNLNHLRKLFDLEPVANTWQADDGAW